MEKFRQSENGIWRFQAAYSFKNINNILFKLNEINRIDINVIAPMLDGVRASLYDSRLSGR